MSKGIQQFFASRGWQYIPLVVKLFEAKVVTQLLYGIPLRADLGDKYLDSILHSFPRKLLVGPYCVAGIALRTEDCY